MKPKVAATLVAVVSAVLATDQLTKSWAFDELSDRSIHVGWTLDLALTLNRGAAFSLGNGITPLLMAGGAVLLVVLIVAGGRARTTIMAVSLGLIIGGAAGNLTDRFLRDNGGAVIDFIDFGWWPVFNVADIALFCGAALLVLSGGFEGDRDGDTEGER